MITILKTMACVAAITVGVILLGYAFSTDVIQMLHCITGGGLIGSGSSFLTITLMEY